MIAIVLHVSRACSMEKASSSTFRGDASSSALRGGVAAVLVQTVCVPTFMWMFLGEHCSDLRFYEDTFNIQFESKIGLIGVRSEFGMSHAWFSLYHVTRIVFHSFGL